LLATHQLHAATGGPLLWHHSYTQINPAGSPAVYAYTQPYWQPSVRHDHICCCLQHCQCKGKRAVRMERIDLNNSKQQSQQTTSSHKTTCLH
jgi:hypothetical protein